jgi:hypothetical protein
MTNAERIVAVLRDTPGLDDDELSSMTGILPRQQVNQICRRLATAGIVLRAKRRGKTVNFIVDPALPNHNIRSSIQTREALESSRAAPPRSSTAPAFAIVNLRTTLFVICCSGSKNSGSSPAIGPSILDFLTESTASQLREARSAIAAEAKIDETTQMPAWRRYSGELYGAAAASIGQAVAENLHIAIISGGYGLLLSGESIGKYDRLFALGDWPKGLLQSIFAEFARYHGLTSLRAFAAASTDYSKLLRRISWNESGVTDAWLLSPERALGAMVKSPRAQGQAFAALLRGELTAAWRSSDGLKIDVMRLP